MLAIFALMTRCGLNVPLFTVVRHARITPSQEARNMVGQGASLDAILEVTDYVARMREEQALALAKVREEQAKVREEQAKVREEQALAKAREFSINCSALQARTLSLQDELLHGHPPLGIAVAMAVCYLQADGHVPHTVVVIDGDDNPVATMTGATRILGHYNTERYDQFHLYLHQCLG
ncbi:hypothetical protein AK812_SmicGene44275 [Symbiodinium microadriaticum]|uniref:Uncharacterized protein n=1 Tax=Symbiodinium microadriaticum TaxID=2951 RepID=A0A1Q9BYV9_SYMMI|nr:hypothetical protein AK812_SmicGene44275 [Symbiodinium microadriaticum]